ncbi:hypothetical protein I4O28_06265 [Clostridioides difficile]|nr:hypothetical protein [Clostridioides difficile]
MKILKGKEYVYMDNLIENLNKIKIRITVTQIEMNTNTFDKLLRTVPQLEQNRKIDYLHSFTGIPIVINEKLKNGEIKILYSDGKYSIISTIEYISSLDKEKSSFKMEYEYDWCNK